MYAGCRRCSGSPSKSGPQVGPASSSVCLFVGVCMSAARSCLVWCLRLSGGAAQREPPALRSLGRRLLFILSDASVSTHPHTPSPGFVVCRTSIIPSRLGRGMPKCHNHPRSDPSRTERDTRVCDYTSDISIHVHRTRHTDLKPSGYQTRSGHARLRMRACMRLLSRACVCCRVHALAAPCRWAWCGLEP